MPTRHPRLRIASPLSLALVLAACGSGSDGAGTGTTCPATCTAGARQCAQSGDVQVCADYDGDGCPEWGGDVACARGAVCANGACAAACTAECADGETVCVGNATAACADTDRDGCPTLGAPTACGDGERCDDGDCVPATDACTDACDALAGATCVEGGRRTCGNFDDDACLEPSVTLPCAAGESCRDGECVPACSDECDPGQTQCRGDGVVSCGNFDADTCLELGPAVACGSGERCDDGRCADGGAACSGTCDEDGARLCTDDGAGFAQCGQFDADPCLELAPPVPCGAGTACSAGACRADCQHECAPGAERCDGERGRQRCANFDADACLEWGAATACAAAERCDSGRCLAADAPCSDDCAQADETRCVAAGLETCGNFDSDACLDWGAAAPCREGERCDGGRCVSACTDDCAAGDHVCGGAGVRTCGNFDADPCREYGPTEACPAGQTCSGGRCAATCTDDCAREGDRACNATGDGYRVCGAYDADPCRDLSSAFPCGATERCAAGLCVASCVDECEAGARRCVGNSVESCGNFDGDPCREFGGSTACAGGGACAAGSCAATCTDDCASGATRCGVGGGLETCGNFDDDRCREWSAPSPCPAAEACDGAACAPRPPPAGVVLNEVVYRVAGADSAGVFIELHGPPGTELRGFRLVGVNGAGGGSTGLIELTGLIPADGFFVVAHPDAAAPLREAADQLAAAVDLQNGPDSVQLRFGAQVVDALGYGTFGEGDTFAGEGTAAPGVNDGQALTRDAAHTDTGNNAADFHVSDAPTPGSGVSCGAACPAEGDTRCTGQVAERCGRDADGCLDWLRSVDCAAEAGRCVSGACEFALGCSLPDGVGAPVELGNLNVTLLGFDVLPLQDTFVVATGSDLGVEVAFVEADGGLRGDSVWLGDGAHPTTGRGATDFFPPSLARHADGLDVAWRTLAATNTGKSRIAVRRLDGTGEPLGPITYVTGADGLAANPVVGHAGGSGEAARVVFSDYRVDYSSIQSVRLGADGGADAPEELSEPLSGSATRGWVALAPAGGGFVVAYAHGRPGGVNTVFFRRLDAAARPAGNEIVVAETGVTTSSYARRLFLASLSDAGDRFALFWGAEEDDEARTPSIHYAVVDGDGEVLSRARLNDLDAPLGPLPRLTLEHVYTERSPSGATRFGVVHTREVTDLEPAHHAVQWMSSDGRAQGRTELGDRGGVLARLPSDGLYRLFDSEPFLHATARVSTLSCP